MATNHHKPTAHAPTTHRTAEVFIVIPISIPLDKMVQCTKPPEHEVRGIADQRSAFVKRLSGFCLCLARVCFYPVTILLSLICIAAAVLAYRNKCDPVTGDCSKAVNLVGVWLLAIVLDCKAQYWWWVVGIGRGAAAVVRVASMMHKCLSYGAALRGVFHCCGRVR